MSSGKDISRRTLFQWLGASALVGPALLGAAARRAEAQVTGSGRPRRLLVLYTPHGAPAELFWPRSATDLTSAGDVSILAPLQRHAARLNILRGIDYVGSDNHYANKDVLTAKGPDSLDTVVARSLNVRPLRLGVVPDYAQSFTVDGYFTMDAGRAVQANPDPVAALAALGVAAAGGAVPNPAPQPQGPSAAALRREALAPAVAELGELRAKVGTSAPAARPDKHRAALARMTAAPTTNPSMPTTPVAGCSATPTLPAVAAMRGKNVWAHENFASVMDAQVEVAAYALRCGLTRVVTLQAGYVNHGVPFTWLGIGAGHHGLSHGVRREHALCQQWFALKFAALLDQLNVPDPEDPGRSILDNTTALWTSEIADGQNHDCKSVPMVLAGGGSGTLRTGQYLQLGSVSHATVLTAMAEAMGVTGQSFGGPGALREIKA